MLKNTPSESWIGIGAWALAIGVGVFLSALLAVLLVVFGAAFVAIGVAGTEAAQRHIPALGHLPLVQDHGFKVVPEHEAAAQTPAPLALPAPGPDLLGRTAILQLGRNLTIELETCRSRLHKAADSGMGWPHSRTLPRAAFDEWSKESPTAHFTKLNESLSQFYVWADDMNHQMHTKETSEINPFMRLPLSLRDSDVVKLETGLRFHAAACKDLKAVMIVTAGGHPELP